MSTIDTLTNDLLSPTTSSSTDSGSLGELTGDEFLQIVLEELSNQDPLDPNDTSALLDQLASIRAIESDTALSENLGELVDQNEFASAASLIGLVVSGLTEDNQRVADYVSSVSKTNDGAVLNTRLGYRIPFEQVDEVITEDELFGDETESTDETGGTDTDDGSTEDTTTSGGSSGNSGDPTDEQLDDEVNE
ncbi:MAG: flagellar hook capping FlgD N-terminal domain-containing protein [Planctomycetota bacterium]